MRLKTEVDKAEYEMARLHGAKCAQESAANDELNETKEQLTSIIAEQQDRTHKLLMEAKAREHELKKELQNVEKRKMENPPIAAEFAFPSSGSGSKPVPKYPYNP